MDGDDMKLSPALESVLKKASEELQASKSGCCFTVDQRYINDDDDIDITYNDNDDDSIYSDILGDSKLETYRNAPTSSPDEEDLTGDRKVIKIQFVPGTGEVIPQDGVVLVHYAAYILNNKIPFDTSYTTDKNPHYFTLGVKETLPGLEIGIKTMKTGEIARFVLKPEVAYKKLGCPPRIPPNSTIVFDVHMISYFLNGDFYYYDDVMQEEVKFQNGMKAAKKLHTEGNEQFKLKNTEMAIYKYDRAVQLLKMVGFNNLNEHIEMMKFLNKLYSNLSICYMKQLRFNDVCNTNIEAMKYSDRFSNHNVKLIFNWGKALRLQKNYIEANIKLQKALLIEPKNITIQSELQSLEKDKNFDNIIKPFIFKKEAENNEPLAPKFWMLFKKRLYEFYESSDDVFTIILSTNSDDIEMVKENVSFYHLQCIIKHNVVTKENITKIFVIIYKLKE